MGINWKIVAGKALGTMADREEEYRKFATDYFTKKFESRSEEVRDFREKIRDQKKEIDKRIDLLRAEGLTDNQIANGLNTFGENFFTVVAEDLKKFKDSDNYEYLISQDATGNKYRDAYRERFDTLIVTDQQRGLTLEPVVGGLLDKLPEMSEDIKIPESIFGFQYTKGIREDIKGLGKEFSNVPEYDAPAGLTGVGELMSGTVKGIPEQQTYTGNMLDKQIVMRLQARFGDLGVAIDGTRFETKADMDEKEIAVVKRAKAAQLKVQKKFNEERSKTPPG